jgi:hypothetical protein
MVTIEENRNLRRWPSKLLPFNVRIYSLSDHILLLLLRSSLWLRLRQPPCEVLLEKYNSSSLLSNLFSYIYIPGRFAIPRWYWRIIRSFDETMKRSFIEAEEPQYIKFGYPRDNDKAYNIRYGRLKLMGWMISSMKHRIVMNRIHLGLMLLRSLNLLWIALSRGYWIIESAPVKWFLSVMFWEHL